MFPLCVTLLFGGGSAFLQQQEVDSCPLTELKDELNPEPHILFVIDINTLRCVCFSTTLLRPQWKC